MEFKIKKNDFFNSFKKMNRIITKNPIFPILENIIIKINEKKLKLTSSNLEVELNAYIDKKFFILYKSGCVAISGKKILNICRNISKDAILHFKIINKKMRICILNSLFELNTMICTNFPIFNDFIKKKEFFISEKILKEIISLIFFSIANNDIRNVLNGILIEYKKNNLYGVTTDGYRLSVYKIAINLNIKNFSIIINKKSILELFRLINYTNKKVKVIINNNYVAFKINEILLKTKILDGNFPNYNDVILKKKKYSILIPTKPLKKSLSKTSILCNTIFKGVCLNFLKNKLIITSKNQEDEKSYDSFIIDNKKIKISFHINVFYLLDILNVLDVEVITISFRIPISSIQIQSDKKKEILYIIMPLKL
ncbi:DNA polymerase III subunit beta [Buchnera aphidicola]|uniref:Beta sliding clamp n=1 Tax=Buchnera aphidicola subsp. Cinara cedri (strain Cc) TaxID=372461 RepID=Q058G0_BUCCC|nr:DNA polymerase III subunit beta [Buchnera aphidicola]ABJ90489.1 DNA polymerase III, b subunit [Buchnera aphidicola BCc]